jgi:hypothetical protein
VEEAAVSVVVAVAAAVVVVAEIHKKKNTEIKSQLIQIRIFLIII